MSKTSHTKRRQLVVGNWKVNGNLGENLALLTAIKVGLPPSEKTNVVVCPPLPYLLQAGEVLKDSSIYVGAQTVSQFGTGAFTGEVSAAMLADAGCRYVIIGHNERRRLLGETNQQIIEQFKNAQAFGLVPILCIGESSEQREQGNYLAHLGEQLNVVVTAVGLQAFESAVVAYEPVWAVGTGVTATPEQANEVHQFIRAQLGSIGEGVQLLYGGSVKGHNAEELFKLPDIDGALLGGASLNAEEFIQICKIADK